jgi:mono/diheme cytochrome c family protein
MRVVNSGGPRLLAVLALAAAGVCFGPAARAQSGPPPGGFDWQVLGEQTYNNNCSGCHQRSGRGIPGGFPPLAGHAAQVAQKGGRAYIVRLVLFGLIGSIEVEGSSYSGNMPSWSDSLRDDEIAAVIDHVLHEWGNDALMPKDFKPILPSEVAAARADKLTPEQVYALRQKTGMQESKAQSTAQAAPTFTREQAERGYAAYAHNCLDCHGSKLDNGEFGGPPLKGGVFGRHWSAGSVAALFSFMRAKMPPDRPGQLNEETYADLTAFILAENGYPPGDRELSADVNAQQAMSLAK